MNEVDTYKSQALQQSMGQMEFHPVFVEEDVTGSNYTKIPLSRIPALGTAFEPLAMAAGRRRSSVKLQSPAERIWHLLRAASEIWGLFLTRIIRLPVRPC